MEGHDRVLAGTEDLQVRVEYEHWNSKYRPHGIYTSHNGYQWTGMALESLDEVRTLHRALGQYIRKREAHDEQSEQRTEG